MFYEKQPKQQQESYKKMLSIIGSLSNLFSENTSPFLSYRVHENCFCRCFQANNLARHDCSADASKGKIGIGLKTWIGGNAQKVAEFGKLKKVLDNLDDDQLILKVAEFRNERITTTMNMYGLERLIYHLIIRTESKMNIEECSFDKIDIEHIKRLKSKDGDNTLYFTDGKHTYLFNKAKTTLYMYFDNCSHLDEIDIKILEDPFDALNSIYLQATNYTIEQALQNSYPKTRKLALKLFKETKDGNLVVERKSGLNIWNAAGRKRHPNEVYIPFNKEDRDRPQNKDFFPPKEVSFDLLLPDGKHISAKICQENGKAIMSNPNKDLGKWLLRDVLELPENTLITYEILQAKGFDTVLFEKIDDLHYKIDFTDSSVYNMLYGLSDNIN